MPSGAGGPGVHVLPPLAEHDRHLVVGAQPGVDRPGQGGEHGPGEGVPGGYPRLGRGHRDGDRHLLGAEVEGALQVRARYRLGEQHRAGLVHGDAQILDLVQGEVQPGGQARRRRSQHGQVGALGGHADRHVVLRRVAIGLARGGIPLARHGPVSRRRGGVFGHVSPPGGYPVAAHLCSRFALSRSRSRSWITLMQATYRPRAMTRNTARRRFLTLLVSPLTLRPPRPGRTPPRPAPGRHETRVSWRQNDLKPGFHGVGRQGQPERRPRGAA